MIKDIKVAAIQAKIPKTTKEGEEQIKRIVAEAIKEPVDMVGLPEDCVAKWKDVMEGYKPLDFLSNVAKESNVYLFGATILKEDNRVRNVGFVFDRSGKLICKHYKMILTPIEEKDGIVPGNKIEVFNTEFGKMTPLVCKDAFHRYAAWFFDKIKRAGADIVLIPSYSLNVSKRSTDLWVDSLKALAKWFDLYIVAPGTVGTNATDFPSFGHALIICPNRGVLAEGSYDKEEMLKATLDAKNLEEIRGTYGALWQPKEVPDVSVVNL